MFNFVVVKYLLVEKLTKIIFFEISDPVIFFKKFKVKNQKNSINVFYEFYNPNPRVTFNDRLRPRVAFKDRLRVAFRDRLKDRPVIEPFTRARGWETFDSVEKITAR